MNDAMEYFSDYYPKNNSLEIIRESPLKVRLSAVAFEQDVKELLAKRAIINGVYRSLIHTPNDKVTFTQTKGNKNRKIPISQKLFQLLSKRRRKLFFGCYYAFEGALKKATLDLPKGQRTHVLRHTFSSHLMMNDGNILVLQQILGHRTIIMTMRYVYFAPDHLDAAVSLNLFDRV